MINYNFIIFVIITFFIYEVATISYFFFNFDLNNIYHLSYAIVNVLVLLFLIIIFILSFFTKNKLRNVTVRQILGEEESKILHFSKSFVVIFDKDERIYWTSYNNHELSKFLYNKKIKDIVPGFDQMKWKNKAMEVVEILNEHYHTTLLKDSNVVLFRNISEAYNLEQKLRNQALVFGYIKIDDLPSLLENESNFKDYQILSIVAETLKKVFKNQNIYFKNINRDLFFFITTKEELNKFIKNDFNVLDKIKKTGFKNNLNLSVSIGVGLGLKSKSNVVVLADEALKKAESRRGDQAVVNDFGKSLQYFGGKSSRSLEIKNKNINIFAKRLIKEIQKSKKIIIMGHKKTDFDALGSALALNKIVFGINNKIESKVAWNLKSNTTKITNFINRNFKSDYINQHIINEKQALNFIDEETLLLIVDTYSPKLVEYPKLLTKTPKIIVLDHHREGNEVIENTILTWVDAAAVSTSEMVVEIIEISNTQKLLSSFEINLLYTGIILDSNHFSSSKLSYRTLQSASLLKYWKANHIEAVDHLKKDQKETFDIYEKLKMAKEIKKGIFFIINKEVVDNVFLAQIGDSFINISDVLAVFVFGLDNEENILVSSRSNGRINVQMIMENFGGGGHYSAAATKVKKGYGSLKTISDEIKKYIVDNKIGDDDESNFD